MSPRRWVWHARARGGGGAASATMARRARHEVRALLQAGFTEATIARQLGASTRTVRWRAVALMNEAGARTRFQLGVPAVEFEWIGAHPSSIIDT